MSGVNEIRSSFLDYFARNGHEPVASSPLVEGEPHGARAAGSEGTHGAIAPENELLGGWDSRDGRHRHTLFAVARPTPWKSKAVAVTPEPAT